MRKMHRLLHRTTKKFRRLEIKKKFEAKTVEKESDAGKPKV